MQDISTNIAFLALNIYIPIFGKRNRKEMKFCYYIGSVAFFLLYSRESKYFVFATYITSVLLLLYRIRGSKDLAL